MAVVRRIWLLRAIAAAGLLAAVLQLWHLWRDNATLLTWVFDPAATEATIAASTGEMMTQSWVEARIAERLAAGDLPTVESYLVIADQQGMVLPEGLRRDIAWAQTPLVRWSRSTGDALEGFVTGDGDSLAHFSGAVASDLMVVGDIRDLGEQGLAYARGEEVDQVIVALSGLGVALSAGTIASLGAAAPAKFGVASLKLLMRAGRIGGSLANEMNLLVRRALPADRLLPALRERRVFDTLGRGQLSALPAAAAAAIVRAGDPSAMRRLSTAADDIAALRRHAGDAAALRLIRHADNTDELGTLAKMSPVLGRRALAFEHSMGKAVLGLAKSSLKLTVRLTAHLLAIVLELFIALMSWLGLRMLRAALARGLVAA